ncbi:MAG: protein-L-isoaspartate(D-aspartate) O-methyltransferase [Candidatus Aenigmarchaeota archaeon]|nr:protein-L-isoaspartate(D-aspartate) O-methyltransferase [Candidatus Aenigmarchaeota archaeon]MBU5688957.1 protein-L-isoaspartate(D-aspartate) O-methyltransferase [Candidatus Aenigmarchaeota archaeon]
MNNREKLVKKLIEEGYLKSPHIIEAMKKVKREFFMSKEYKKYAYIDQPFPIPPFTAQTISAPHTYAIIYEALELKENDKFLEIGTGSGYGAVLAKEIVKNGLVVSIEINKETFEFAKKNIEKAGYKDIILFNRDGKLGCPEYAPFDKICVTAAAKEIPHILIDQLKDNGKMIVPVGPEYATQKLVLIEKKKDKINKKTLTYVVYVPLI